MKFTIAKSHRYWWPVTVRLPKAGLEQAGELEEQELRVQFEPLDRETLTARQREYEALRGDADRAQYQFDQLAEVVRDWDGVVDDGGKPMPFSAEAFAQALSYPWFRAGLFTAYTQSLSGEAARLGN